MLNKSNFIGIFSAKDENTGMMIDRSIIIPIIQRDYAQGRDDERATRVREKFLQALYSAVTDAPITLDFIYGSIDKEKNVITLLDGQQRITTLFLLHWYAAKKASLDEKEYEFLKRFGYETRYSSRLFCKDLVNYTPDFSIDQVSDDIEDQPWFALGWKNDPTIKSMLNMIDAIHDKFKNVPDLWEKLKTDVITFYFLPIEDMGLTDELYIKMNSRGKPLSEFENFKAELEGEVAKYDKNKATEISRKIDGVWTDLLWNYKDDSNTIDVAFLNLFRTICQIIAYKDNQSFGRSYGDSFDLLSKYFDAEAPEFEKHLLVLESCFDNWYEVSKRQPLEEFFEKHLTAEHDGDKVKVGQRYSGELDIFKDCVESSVYNLPKLILFYAFMVYLDNRASITEKEFDRRLRVVNNLILNSQDEISDLESRVGGNRMPAILRQTDSIIVSGIIDVSVGISFNANQLEEEAEKLDFTKKHPELAEKLFALEDHELLAGQIAILGLDQYEIFDRFGALFDCDYDKINRALLAIGDYSQEIGHETGVYQFGTTNNTAWRSLFHRSARNFGFEKTSEILIKLLNVRTEFSDEILDAISQKYIEKCRAESIYDWRYYFIKYAAFRPDPKREKFYGKYYNPGFDMYVMVTDKRLSENAYSPFLKEVSKSIGNSNVWFEHDNSYNGCLGIMYVGVTNAAYRFNDGMVEKMSVKTTDEGYRIFEVEEKIKIKQNGDGVDAEDRIEKLVKLTHDDFGA